MVSKCSILEERGENLLQEDFKVFLLTKTPLPNTPPKNQTSSERCLLSSITFPPGKNNRMLARQPKTERGISVPDGRDAGCPGEGTTAEPGKRRKPGRGRGQVLEDTEEGSCGDPRKSTPSF